MLYLLLIWHGVMKMKIKTAELTGNPLSWALAKAVGKIPYFIGAIHVEGGGEFGYTDPATCMGLIERRNLDVNHRDPLRLGESVLVSWGDPNDFAYGYWFARGKTLAEAVARCVVQMRLGDEVEVPDELCGVKS
jgi:hypothetical protein